MTKTDQERQRIWQIDLLIRGGWRVAVELDGLWEALSTYHTNPYGCNAAPWCLKERLAGTAESG